MKKTLKGLLVFILSVSLISIVGLSAMAQEDCECTGVGCELCTEPSTLSACVHTSSGDSTCLGFICDTCSEYFGEPNADAHVFGEYDDHGVATCELDATKSSECLHCGELDIIEIDNTAGHIWKEATIKAPMTCLECGETRGEPLVAVGYHHTPNDWFSIFIGILLNIVGVLFGLH